VTTLASIRALSEHLHRGFDPTDVSMIRALEEATSIIRRVTGQQITEVAEDEVEFRGSWGHAFYLPQLPVTDVAQVEVRYADSTTFLEIPVGSYNWDRMGLLSLLLFSPVVNAASFGGTYWGGEEGVVRVTYDHGYAVVPSDIETACLLIAGRLFRNAPGGGVLSETTPLYSYTAPSGILALQSEELRLLKDYSRRSLV
jgi:hypothetical protein